MFGEKFRALRKSTGLKTQVFCDRLGITSSYMYILEKTPRAVPAPAKLVNYLRLLGTTVKANENLFKTALQQRHTLNLDELPDDLKQQIADIVFDYYVKEEAVND